MARRNISIPDDLDERLDQHRDRINASRVCAIALERELDMIEQQTRPLEVEESKVERLVERLRQQQTEKDNWYGRGRRDGEAWAQNSASLNELRAFEENWSGLEGMTLADFDPGDLEGWDDVLPEERQPEVNQQPLVLRGAYLLGWYAGVRDLWRAARTHL
ncbi:hypothetical protein [Actinopolymorpha rutila]|uniref:Uncharacterized protein n=1 Tax=Actinopolymorpha rutila TaxID=446787 RepID=A0A852ZIC6_9ACTN|nr:hypothetical protein [Actinopolymorpha rutila]NYH92861.1 hypothetical protein [Actinopolymorpha rutila]